jgi:hypothetical protein
MTLDLFAPGAPAKVRWTGAALAEGSYRYGLARNATTEGGPTVVFVMLNPSKADTSTTERGQGNDPTVRKCIGFAERWGFKRLYISNLFAYRATDPRELARAYRAGVDVVGPQNDDVLRATFGWAPKLVVAWGAFDGFDIAPRVRHVEAFFRCPRLGAVECLGRTASGAPRHPLMLAYSTQLEPWSPKGGA